MTDDENKYIQSIYEATSAMYDSMAPIREMLRKDKKKKEALLLFRLYAIIGISKDQKRVYFSILRDDHDYAYMLDKTSKGEYLDKIIAENEIPPESYIRNIRNHKMNFEIYWPSESYFCGIEDNYGMIPLVSDQIREYVLSVYPNAKEIFINKKKEEK